MDQLSLTNPCNALHHGQHPANKQDDKLVTEPS